MLRNTARLAGTVLRKSSINLVNSVSRRPIAICYALHPRSQVELFGFPPIKCAPVMVQCRFYAKGKKEKKDKANKKDKGGKKSSQPRVEVGQEDLNRVVNYDKYKLQMQLVVDNLKREYIEQLSIRSAAGSLDRIPVETADGKFPLIQIAQIVQKNPNLMVINCTMAPQYIGDVKKAIVGSGMNLNPQQDGTSLFIPIPKVTREHRENLAKNAKMLCDKSKDKLRDTHNRYLRDLKKQKDESKDLIHNIQETLQGSFTDYTKEAEALMAMKQKDLLEK